MKLAGLAATLAVLALAGCGGGSDTTSGASGATGAAGAESQLTADAQAKIAGLKAQTAMEVYATDNNGSYAGANPTALQKIEPSIPDGIQVTGSGQGYKITVPSSVGDSSFTASRDAGGTTSFTCEVAGEGGCPASGKWR
jgi:hypothetical protein